MWFPNRSDTNGLYSYRKELEVSDIIEEELYYLSSENKGADQLRGFVYFQIFADCCFSHEAAQIILEPEVISMAS